MDPVRARLPLSERLRPERLAEMVGNAEARRDLRAWAERWRSGVPPGHRAVLLVGPPGVGKTTAAMALARELGWAFVEMNASDARNQTAIEQVAGRASVSQGLDATTGPGGMRRTLILLDEADCLSGRVTEGAHAAPEPVSLREFLRRRYTSLDALNAAWGLPPTGKVKAFPDWESVPRSPGRSSWANLAAARRDLDDWRAAGVVADVSDRGGLGAIARLVRTTRQPIVLTVNDDRSLLRYSPVFRSNVTRLRFGPLRDAEISARLVEICRSEAIALAPGVLEAIVGRSRGDLRAALNDLEAVAPLAPGPAQREALGARDLEADFAEFTSEVFGRPRFYRSVEVQARLDAPPDDLLPWIEENLDRFSEGPARRDAGFRVLAVAERFLARARRARVYGLWSYASELLSGGVPLAVRDRPVSRPIEARFPRFLIEMGRSRGTRATRGLVASKIGARLHVSRAKSVLLLVPFVETLLSELVRDRPGSRGHTVARALVAELGLSPEELTYLLGDRADADLVEELTRSDGPSADDPERAASSDASPPVSETGAPSTGPGPRRRVQRSLAEFGRGA